MDRSLTETANDYFNYLGRYFPQQCANDEFYFLPRSERAIEHLDRLDDLTAEKVQDHIKYTGGLLDKISSKESDVLEDEIDRLLIRQSIESFMREFGEAEVWRNDPTLYIKIPLFATDQIVSSALNEEQIRAMLHSLFDQIPSFLNVGIENVQSASEISQQVAIDMVTDAIHFYQRDIRRFIEQRLTGNTSLIRKNSKVLNAWEKFRAALVRLSSGNDFAIGQESLSKIIATSLGYPRSTHEILEIAQCACRETLEEMEDFAKGIDKRKTWKGIIYENLPPVESQQAFIELFSQEVLNLRRFFRNQNILTIPPGENVVVLETPSYLKSLRATASYKAPLTGGATAHGIFYITPGKDDRDLITAHCPYLCAHETYPGHHILDHVRIRHSNPIRRQIESPLFYEGWACYVEQLLDELGYIRDPRQQLVQLKRQLWRNLRAVLDVKLQTGMISMAEAAREIENVGFSSGRAQRQIRRFCLTPGYQLCYFMGAYEINRLRNKFSSRMGLKSFHDTLLNGGQIPFHLAERRLRVSFQNETEQKGQKKNSFYLKEAMNEDC